MTALRLGKYDFNTYYTGNQKQSGDSGGGTSTEPDESPPRFGYKPMYGDNFNEIYSTHHDVAHQVRKLHNFEPNFYI